MKNSKIKTVKSTKKYQAGGAIKKVPKKQMGGMTEEMCKPGDPCHKSNKKANNRRLRDAGVSRSVRKRMI